MSEQSLTDKRKDEMPKERVRCKCGKFGITAPCPYSREINDDDTPCDCCRSCREDHAGDI